MHRKEGERGGELIKWDTQVKKKTDMSKLSEDELVFLIDYKRLEDLEIEKAVKFFVCIGDESISRKMMRYVMHKRN
jgi:hypothetical protein